MSDTSARLTAALSSRYAIERELGRGGMATVFLARDLRHQRFVALKVLHPELTAVLGTERFLKEIELTAGLQHPHILPLFDSGEIEGQLYYVMPLMEGETLRARLDRERQLPIPDAIRIANEVADALDYAHRRNVIHRDIKPENILLQDGHAIVADFGIALAVEQAGGQRITQTGLSLGTPHYMAPEQATGEKTIDARADIYALGAMTYEMLVGEPPFTGPNTQAIIARLLTTAPSSIIATRSTVSPAIERTVLTALAKLPADRFSSARAFSDALNQSVQAPHVAELPATLPTQGAVTSRRATRLAFAVVGAAIALGGYGLVRALASSSPPIHEFGRSAHVTWDPGLEVLPAISPDGKQVAYSAGSSVHFRLYVRPVGGGRATLLTDDSTASEYAARWSHDGTRLLYLSHGRAYTVPVGGGSGRQEVPDQSGPLTSVAWSPDERRIAFTIADSLFVRDEKGAVKRLATMREPTQCVWGAGDLIACVVSNRWYQTPGSLFNNRAPSGIVVVPADGGTSRTIAEGRSGNVSPQWSADGRWLYYLSDRLGPMDVFAQRVNGGGSPSGQPVRLTTGLNAHTFTISSDGKRLAFAGLSEIANAWSTPLANAGSSRPEQVTFGQQSLEAIVPTTDGRWLYYNSTVAGSSDLFRLSLGNGRVERLTSTDSLDEFGPSPSPDGRELIFHMFRNGSRDLFTLPLDGGPAQVVSASTALSEGLGNWSPDGKAILFSDLVPTGGTYLARRQPDRSWKVTRMVANGFQVHWAPDSRHFSYSSDLTGGSLVVGDVDGGPPRTVYSPDSLSRVRAQGNAWSDDGRTIYFKTTDEEGNASIWSVATAGGKATKLADIGDARHRSDRYDFGYARGRFYYILKERESDIWTMDIIR